MIRMPFNAVMNYTDCHSTITLKFKTYTKIELKFPSERNLFKASATVSVVFVPVQVRKYAHMHEKCMKIIGTRIPNQMASYD
jgi:hypothetical protein